MNSRASSEFLDLKPDTNPRSGVALIICLGLLAVMTLMAVTFSIAMRVERQAARNYADGVRAAHMIRTAFVRAMEDIDFKMTNLYGRVYPDEDVWASTGPGVAYTNLMTAEALETIPFGLTSLNLSQLQSKWVPIGVQNSTMTGRVAFVVVNTSGLLDIMSLGDAPRTWSTNVTEIDFTGAPELTPFARQARTNLLAARSKVHRYETLGEMRALSPSIFTTNAQTFNTFSYDPGPDMLFFTAANPPAEWWAQGNAATWVDRIEDARPPPRLGKRDAVNYLGRKFNINAITNFTTLYGTRNPDGTWNLGSAARDPHAYANDSTFMRDYWNPLHDMIRIALNSTIDRADDVTWNIVNYLDPDSTPNGARLNGSSPSYPWLVTEGGEAIPLINEIVVLPVTTPTGVGYVLNVEVWYPWSPSTITPADEISVQGWIYTGPSLPGGGATVYNITNASLINTNFSFSTSIPIMEFGSSTEYVVVTNSTPITFPPGTNGLNTQLGQISPLNPSDTNDFWILARVVSTASGRFTIVDEAMGYDPNDQAIGRRRLFRVFEEKGYGVNDPRSNGQVKYWTSHSRYGQGFHNGEEYTNTLHTLGGMNVRPIITKSGGNTYSGPICEPYIEKGSGVPLYVRDSPMLSITELGHIFQSNLDDEDDNPRNWYWRNISLMRANEGALLMDMMTAGDPRPPMAGLFCINSRQTNAWHVMFNNLHVGAPNITTNPPHAPGLPFYQVPTNDLVDLVRQKLLTNSVSFFDLFAPDDGSDGGGGDLATAFRYCAPNHGQRYSNTNGISDYYKEDTFRSISSLVSFRQNIFTVIMAAQVMSPDGSTPISERRAVATVYRDAYTGRHFTRNFKWLED